MGSRARDLNLFINLSLDACQISGTIESKKSFILVVHVAADSNRALSHESLFSRSFPPFVPENLSFTTNEHIRNDLLQAGIVFGRRPWREKIILPR
jgi:hypothetical protein